MACKKSKTRRLVAAAFRQVKGEKFKGGEKQRVAVALAKARKAGARIPKP